MNYLIGEKLLKIDDKNRITIPEFTNLDVNTKLVLKKEINSLYIYLYSEYLNILNKYITFREKATSINEYERISKKIEEICETIRDIPTIGTNHKIVIPHHILDELQWHSNDNIFCKGLGISLLLTKK